MKADELRADLLSITGHKFYGPKGVGALYVRKGIRLVSLMHGGEQEKRRRARTENVLAVVGLGKAAGLAGQETDKEAERLTELRDRLFKGLEEEIDHIRLNRHPIKRLLTNVNISVDFVEWESMFLNLDLDGICGSIGSACSSASLQQSYVLLALGLSLEQAHGSLKFTFGHENTEADVEPALEVLPRIVAKLRAMSALLKSTK